MTYLAWAMYAEGTTDTLYFETLLPRIILDLAQKTDGPEAKVPELPVDVFGISTRSLDTAAEEICAARDAFSLLFVHGDTGGPAQEQHLANRTCALCERIHERCGFPRERCVVIAPRRETESWCLADKSAIRAACGLTDDHDLSFVPENADALEGIADPKSVMAQIQASLAIGRRRRVPPVPYASLGQMQELNRLRALPSFETFESELIVALRTLGYPNLR